MKTFRITLRHDKGILRVKLSSSSEEKAKLTLLEIENCPPSAIIKCEELQKHTIFLN